MPLHYIIFQTGYGNREAGQQRSEWKEKLCNLTVI